MNRKQEIKKYLDKVNKIIVFFAILAIFCILLPILFFFGVKIENLTNVALILFIASVITVKIYIKNTKHITPKEQRDYYDKILEEIKKEERVRAYADEVLLIASNYPLYEENEKQKKKIKINQLVDKIQKLHENSAYIALIEKRFQAARSLTDEIREDEWLAKTIGFTNLGGDFLEVKLTGSGAFIFENMLNSNNIEFYKKSGFSFPTNYTSFYVKKMDLHEILDLFKEKKD